MRIHYGLGRAVAFAVAVTLGALQQFGFDKYGGVWALYSLPIVLLAVSVFHSALNWDVIQNPFPTTDPRPRK